MSTNRQKLFEPIKMPPAPKTKASKRKSGSKAKASKSKAKTTKAKAKASAVKQRSHSRKSGAKATNEAATTRPMASKKRVKKEELAALENYEATRTKVAGVIFAAVLSVVLFVYYNDFGFGNSAVADESVAAMKATELRKFELLAPQNYECKVTEVFAHNENHFTQGFHVHKSQKSNQLILLESTGLYGKGKVVKYDYGSGEVLAEYTLADSLFGEGSALCRNRRTHKVEVFVLTWRKRVVLVLDYDSLKELRRLPLPSDMKEGWGLHFDEALGMFLATDGSSSIFFIEPNEFKVVKIVKVLSQKRKEVANLNDLTVVNGWVLVNVWFKPYVLIVSPFNGRVYGYLQCASIIPSDIKADRNKCLNGITFNPTSGNLVLTGKMWPEYYEIETPSFILNIRPPGNK